MKRLFNLIRKKGYGIDSDDIKIVEELGRGAFGVVYKGLLKKEYVAVKKVINGIDETSIEEFEKEIDILKKVKNEFIIRFLGASLKTDKICIVTELAPLGSLSFYISKRGNNNPVPNKLRNKIMIDAAKGISYLHSNGILHRDIKPDNILVMSEEDNVFVNCKITDFGSSRRVDLMKTNLLYTSGIGTPAYMAPEVLDRNFYNNKADIYSLAITMYECYGWCECYPKPEFKYTWDITDFVTKGKRKSKPPRMTNEQYLLIEQCWNQDPNRRILITELVDLMKKLCEETKNKKEETISTINSISVITKQIDPSEIQQDQNQVLGKGSFGTVYKGIYGGKKVAIKEIIITDEEKAKIDFIREIEVLEKCESDYIIKYFGTYSMENFNYIVTEFAQLGSLNDILLRNNKIGEISMKIRIKMMIDSAKGIQYLHSNNILHRDIKPANILVFSLGDNEKVNAKLTDFGSSRVVDSMKNLSLSINIGTPTYMAPEVLKRNEYDHRSDIYSLAITMYECYGWCECYPKPEFKFSWDITDFVTKGKRRPKQDNMTNEQYQLIDQCWKQEPSDRISMNEILLSLNTIYSVSSNCECQPAQTNEKTNSLGEIDWVKKMVAIKKMKSDNQLEMELFIKEVKMLQNFRSEYIIHFYGVNYKKDKIYLVTEFAQFGSLQDLINNQIETSVTMKLRIKMMMDVTKGIFYLHSNGILHRDIKPDNILVVSTDCNSDVNAKISGFGTAKNFYSNELDLRESKTIGTLAYIAPEIMSENKFSFQSDIYSFAITMYECFGWCDCYPKTEFGLPFKVSQFVSQGKRRPKHKNMTIKQYQLIDQCWKQDPKERIRISDVINTLFTMYKMALSAENELMEEWTQMSIGNIIFDSNIDDWGINTSVFDQRIINKSNLIFLIEDEEGNKFGGYVNAKIDNVESFINDPNSFVFSLNQKKRYSIMESENAFYLHTQENAILFRFENDICVGKKEYKNQTFCLQSSFNYGGIEKALGVKTYPERIPTKRVIVIQMG